MNYNKDKYGYYEKLKDLLSGRGVEVSESTEINYGLQFHIIVDGVKSFIRIYESKKSGTRYDLSQIKNEEVLRFVEELIKSGESALGSVKTEAEKSTGAVRNSDMEELELIGTDESGKGDYFGPLVIAGVYANPAGKKLLKQIGAADSKTLSDARIEKLAQEIMNNCIYSVVTIGNKRYNDLYGDIKNLNKLLAWGHARVIENLLEKVDCRNALSDQFGNPELIKNALMEKGKLINLEQRPRAEENVVVAAASILARYEFVNSMKKISEEFGMEFPKGASSSVTDTAREFIKIHGREKLNSVAKLHFSITERL